jgi:restriction system protein
MIKMDVLIGILILGIAGYFMFWKYRKEIRKVQSFLADLITTSDDLHKTLAIGLYHRFKKKYDIEDEKAETPLDFERFVAKIIEDYYGGTTYVTRASGDFGVDIEHTREDGLYLGQVKCYAPHENVDFTPIAIIHSQMVKQNAKGGFVVTTSSFTSAAREYAEGLNIELIDGYTLVEYWAKGIENKREKYQALEPGVSL